MLTSLVLSLTRAEPADLPRDLGRASHALFLRLVGRHDAGLAERLHAGDGPKPFTCSNLQGGHRRSGSLMVAPGDALWLRYTALSAEASAALKDLVASPPESVELDGVQFQVTGATVDPAVHPRAGSTSYETLGAPYLLSRRPPEPRITLRFVSPTAFRARGQNLPLPLPGSVFGSLADRWNAFAPIGVPEELRRFADECLAVSQFRGRTRMLRGKDGGVQIGFVGTVRFAATNRDRYWLSLVNMLADFAAYSGVGYQTTAGMGQVRRMTEEAEAERAA